MHFELFLIFGGLLVLGALVISAVGAKSESFPPNRGVLIGIVGIFAVLVAGTATYGWIHAADEKEEKEAKIAEEEAAAESAVGGKGEAAKGITVRALSSPADGALVYTPDGLKAPAGVLELIYDNPSMVPHNVALEFEGNELAKSEIVTKGESRLKLDLDPGEYVFYCTVPGHRQGGMEGDLLVTGRVN